MLPTPLQVTLCLDKSNPLAKNLANGLEDCFRGRSRAYLDGAIGLNVEVRERDARPKVGARSYLNQALHGLVIVFATQRLTKDTDFANWLDDIAGQVLESDLPSIQPNRAHRLLIVDLDGSAKNLRKQGSRMQRFQALNYEKLSKDEAIRPAKLALIALKHAAQIVSRGSPMIQDQLRFFVSHAKLDGQPMAKVLSDLINKLPGFRDFYDAKDIEEGSDWQRVLEEGVRDSVLLALRSDLYETRDWCKQETHWAEQYATPMLVVDLRNGLNLPPSKLALDGIPTVRINDGNFYRILFAGSSIALTARMFLRQVQHFFDTRKLDPNRTRILVRRPSMLALHTACADLIAGLGASGTSATSPGFVLVPEDAMSDAEWAAAKVFAQSMDQNLRIETLDSMIVKGYLKP
ncbi:toll/interleukin-1 receptor domain-containing protein [Shimia sp. R10_1]|uniref:toll/interleukin-1 receptor domain-containing protein n=1 Tax=Shimia sp. R10_1 TaxID=2821095 RepID=UPI001ADA1116|nr:toll/interleukin-1 receptor domain-containing protein [Shimia sp. R10_1]MBO9475841.1 toll/interleukin-1 receptor domain-containing protein [Shimia sp. R10_1]